MTGDELAYLGRSLLTPSALTELGVFFGCVALSWVVVRLVRGAEFDRRSIWFSRNIVDGVLFLASGSSRMMTGQSLVIDGGVVVTG